MKGSGGRIAPVILMIIGALGSRANAGDTLDRFLPPPSSYRYAGLTDLERTAIVRSIMGSLKDPDSLRMGPIVASRGREPGKYACGFFDARNSFGGYAGGTIFYGHFNAGEFRLLTIGGTDFSDRLALSMCRHRGLGENLR